VAQREVPIGDGTIELCFTVENFGPREGTEVVQNYVRDRLASSARPVRELKAFARVPLAAGDSAQVRVRVPVDMLNFTDGRGERIVEPGDFDLMVGGSNRDIHLSDTVSVTGQAVRTLERDWRMVSEVEVLS
jgi:beta-glucosidase